MIGCDMCGINGFTFEDERLIRGMNAATAHRGPDGADFHVGLGISLGQNRLSISDTDSAARQPLWSHDRRHIIVFNGEIYNHIALRSELSGFPFRTMSDTETILAAYGRWGARCVERFDGMFSFAIWTPERDELFLARDPQGVKPLYYRHENGQFFFSSEMKGLLADGSKYPLSLAAFSLYMRSGYVPGPFTMFSGVLKFPPGHRGCFSQGMLRIEPYTPLVDHSRFSRVPYGSRSAAREGIREAISESVTQQLVARRPLGIYLSGGLDSSVILDCAFRASSSPLSTFSAGFDLHDGEEGMKFNADFFLARRIAAHYGTRHHESLVAGFDIIPLLELASFHLDEPIANPTAIAMMKLARDASSDIRVILSGDGGDELFGGYKRYRLSRRMDLLRLLPRFLQPSIIRETEPFLDRFGLFMWEKDARLASVLTDDFLTDEHRRLFGVLWERARGSLFESAFMDIDRETWLVDESLLRTDRTTMAYGIEARVPFLSASVIAVSRRTPLSYKVDIFTTKSIMRGAFRGRVPDYVLNQPKRGWISPGAKWLRRPGLHAYANELFSASYCPATAHLFKWDAVRTLLDRHVSRDEYALQILWKILSFQAWAHAFEKNIFV